MSTACCPAPIVVSAVPASRHAHAPTTEPPLLQRAWQWLRAGARGFIERRRAAAHERACWRAMQGLSDATLRDIGLAERSPPRPHTPGPLDLW